MTVLDLLRQDVTMQRADLAAFVTSGGPKDYAGYCKAVGAIQALDMVLMEIDKIEKRQIEADV